MTDIRSEGQLRAAFEKDIEKALNKVTVEVLKIFQNEFIRKYAYYNEGKNKNYYDKTGEPSWEFYKAWQWTSLKKMINSLVTELWYNPAGVEFEMSKFKHGSKFSSPVNVSANMPAILEGKQSSLWMSVPRKGKFWELFIEEMFDGGKLEKILIQKFQEVGLKLVKI